MGWCEELETTTLKTEWNCMGREKGRRKRGREIKRERERGRGKVKRFWSIGDLIVNR